MATELQTTPTPAFGVGAHIRSKRGNTRRVVVATHEGQTIVRSHDWRFARVINDDALREYWEYDEGSGHYGAWK